MSSADFTADPHFQVSPFSRWGQHKGVVPICSKLFRLPRFLSICSDLHSLFLGIPRFVPIFSDLFRSQFDPRPERLTIFHLFPGGRSESLMRKPGIPQEGTESLGNSAVGAIVAPTGSPW